jgi:chemotaxis protein methyltransferase CheR
MAVVTLGRAEFSDLQQFVHAHLGIHLNETKMSMVEQRLRPWVETLGFQTFRDFIDRALKKPTPAVMTELVNRITTNHTYFNRESEHFTYLSSVVLPEITTRARSRPGKPTFRMWCAAASRGHEPYTLAMLQRKFWGPEYNSWDAGLLATDISEKALGTAIVGRYPDEEVQALPKDLREKYLRKVTEDEWEVAPELKRDVTYRKFNLNDASYPFRRPFDAIFCRNVLIYFDPPTKRDVVTKLAQVLEPKGYLFVGLAESLGREVGTLRAVQAGVYQKIG